MITSTTPDIPGKKIVKSLGIARGSTVRTRNIGRDIMAAFKNIAGGEIKSYTQLMADAREQALQRMIEDAKRMQADGVCNVRFTTSTVMAGAAEILAYGTAVTLE